MNTESLHLKNNALFILINLIFFQGIWLLTVFGAANNIYWYGLLGLAAFVIFHHFTAGTARADFLLVAIAVATGLLIETAFVRTGLLVYTLNIPSPQFAPAWILILWADFALTMNGCLRWLQGRYLLAAALGAIGGPISYFAGVKLGAATTNTSMLIVLPVIASVYALITPLFLMAARRLPGILVRKK